MKTRPHIVTQTHLYDTHALTRSADLIAARMGTASSLKNLLGYSRVLIRVMKIILDLTLHNNCFARRREVLDSPRLRRSVMERLGGAQALRLWRRRQAWNKARLAAIACGEYRPASSRHATPTPRPAASRKPQGRPGVRANDASHSETPPANFRLPALQNLSYVHRPGMRPVRRAAPQRRSPAVVLWPHELDGQYVPNFKSRAGFPIGTEYGAAAGSADRSVLAAVPAASARGSPR